MRGVNRWVQRAGGITFFACWVLLALIAVGHIVDRVLYAFGIFLTL